MEQKRRHHRGYINVDVDKVKKKAEHLSTTLALEAFLYRNLVTITHTCLYRNGSTRATNQPPGEGLRPKLAALLGLDWFAPSFGNRNVGRNRVAHRTGFHLEPDQTIVTQRMGR